MAEGLIKRRSNIKGSMTKMAIFVSKLSENNADMDDLKIRLKRADELLKEFTHVEDALFGIDPEAESGYDAFEDKYYSVVAKLNKWIRKISTAQGNTSLSGNDTDNLNMSRSTSGEVKLPRINIPIFRGDYTEWQSFYDLFVSTIHDNPLLNPAKKFQYLKGYLGGEAANLVKHCLTTDANYLDALNRLKETYDRKKLIVNNFIERFTNQPKIRSPTADSIQNLMFVGDEVTRGLRAIGPVAEARDPWLIYLMKDKLDDETKDQWSRKTTSNEFPTFEEFLKFLRSRVDALRERHQDGRTKAPSQQPTQSSQQKSVKSFVTTAFSCPVCKCNDHLLFQCIKFKDMPIQERRNLIKTETRCFNCLSDSHVVTQCKSKKKCHHCPKRHNSLLHLEPEQIDSKLASAQGPKQMETLKSSKGDANQFKFTSYNCASCSTNLSDTVHLTPSRSTILPTALVRVKDGYGQYQFCKVLLDTGSETSFISEPCVQRLALKRRYAKIAVQGLGQISAGHTKGMVSLQVIPNFKSDFTLALDVFVLPKITSISASLGSMPPNSTIINQLPLADPHFDQASKIDILIGADKFFSILSEGLLKDPDNNPIAHNTKLGWIIAGNFQTSSQIDTAIISLACELDLDYTLRKLWETEEPPSDLRVCPSHKICEDLFASTTTRNSDHRFIVRLPFDPNPVPIGESFFLAKNRLLAMERRFQREPNFYLLYKNFMEEYINLGHMEEISRPAPSSSNYYLPHHGVIKADSTTTKLRVVFDGSAKTTSGNSLNDTLLVGPTIQNTLYNILLMFRVHQFVFCADVEKMYRQIWVHENDRKFQTILWRSTSHEPIHHYQLKTVTYGLSSSPFLATRVLQQLDIERRMEYPKASYAISKNMYIDDLMTGATTLAEAIALKKDIKEILSNAKLHLRKWTSNSKYLLEDQSAAQSTKDITENPEIQKVLGLRWIPETDNFTFRVDLPDVPPRTRRKILSEASRIFDPLGVLAPFVIRIKIMFQRLWLLNIDWDEEIPCEAQKQWLQIRETFPHLQYICIPRWLQTSGTEMMLHGFCDSSEQAFAASIYVRTTDSTGITRTALVTAKTKVAPVKSLTLPRLELCGAVLLTKLMIPVAKTLNVLTENIFVWTDSTIVLDWLSAPPKQWDCFISNRTSQIQNQLPRHHWHHVPTKQNPADCATRGLTPIELQNHRLWWTGPEWLAMNQTCWPTFKQSLPLTTLEKRKKYIQTFAVATRVDGNLIDQICERFSDFDKICMVLAFIRRFIENCRATRHGNQLSGALKRSEYFDARNTILRRIQAISYEAEIKAIHSKLSLPSKSKLKYLSPFFDKLTGDNLLRVEGRIGKSFAPYMTKHPIIIPGDSETIRKLVRQLHIRYFHCGQSHLISLLRTQYWVIGVTKLVKSIIHHCVNCVKRQPKLLEQQMGELPAERVQIARPFQKVGLDFAGPLKTYAVRGRGQRTYKTYICIFVCLSIKAVHIELVHDLTTESFLGALKRFMSRRGICSDIFSDNASNFKGAKNQLGELNKFLKQNVHLISSSIFREFKINWHFIPPNSPHFGGLWEAAVKSAKTQLHRIIGDHILTFEELHTLMTQIEGILNARPICQLADNQLDMLTPSHFLIGHPHTIIPEPDLSQITTNRISRWQMIQKLTQHFWKRWNQEFLTSLQPRTKWPAKRPNIDINRIVLIKEANPITNQYTMGRVVKIHPGTDGLIRVVTIKTKHGEFVRPIHKLAVLPVEIFDVQAGRDVQGNNTSNNPDF